MQTQTSDDSRWAVVLGELRDVLGALDTPHSRAMGAPIHTRLAAIRLQRAALGTEVSAEAVSAALTWQGEAAALDDLSSGARFEAMAHLHDALAVDAHSATALRAAATLTASSGRWVESAAHLQTLATIAADDQCAARALLKRADILHRKMGRPLEAREALLEARARVGDDPTVLDRLLKVELEREAWSSALEICYTLIERLGSQSEATALAVTYRLTLGEIHVFGLDSPVGALRHYLEAIQVLPAYALAYTLLEELVEQNDGLHLLRGLARLPEHEHAHLKPTVDHLSAALEANVDDPAAAITALRIALQARRAGL